MRAMKWGETHTDVYSFYWRARVWLKVRCTAPEGTYCMGPSVLPAGAKLGRYVKADFSLNVCAVHAMRAYDDSHPGMRRAMSD